MTSTCRCPHHPGRSITNQAAHTTWHALVVGQGGPAGVVDLVSLQRARGAQRDALVADVGSDEKTRRRAVSALRRRAIAVLT